MSIVPQDGATTPETVGLRVRELRESTGLSQSRLASLTGIARDKLNKIENGHRDLSHGEAVSIAAVLGITPDDLEPPKERIQFRGRGTTPETDDGIAVFERFVRNWQILHSLEAIDADR